MTEKRKNGWARLVAWLPSASAAQREGPSRLLRYGVALISVGSIIPVKLSLDPFIDRVDPFLPFAASVIISAWYGGLGPGLFATFLSALFTSYFFLPPYRSISPTLQTLLPLGLFLLEGGLISVLTAALRSAVYEIAGSLFEVQKRETALRESEERYRLLIEAVSDYAIFALDPAGHVANWNRGAERLIGYRQEEILGKPFSLFYPPDERARGRPEEAFRHAVSQGRFEHEGWCVRRDGSRLWAHLFVAGLYDHPGHLVGFSMMIHDLTERKRGEETLAEERRKKAQAEAASRLKSQQVSVVSHDLRSPLNAIIGYARLLSQGIYGPVEERQKPALEGILKNADSQLRLISELLDLAKLESGKISLQSEEVDLDNLFDVAIAEVKPLLDRKGLALRRQEERPLPHILSDGVKIKQVLSNLLANAVQYTNEGSVSIEAREAKERGGILVTVRDTGIGIKAEELPLLFDLFYRGEEAQRVTGAGLGLAIVKELVRLLGGSVEVESVYGEGSVFTLFLPYRSPTENR